MDQSFPITLHPMNWGREDNIFFKKHGPIPAYCPTATRKTPGTRHAGGGRYGNGIFHCILGVKERAVFHLTQKEPSKVSFRFLLWSKTKSFNALLSSTRLHEATLFRVYLVVVGQYLKRFRLAHNDFCTCGGIGTALHYVTEYILTISWHLRKPSSNHIHE
ncbi:hypothetical protein AVEN_122963-1 [Araneus ventricosus]|uniref:Uncharacterized protein n=1 Tax=Araneus ventricosus TaxID=182803 RepID=A0A4Y2ULH2_ARAVE|nr:hypothetical protein AVEN_122963-1 [Araneus ventricosus]